MQHLRKKMKILTKLDKILIPNNLSSLLKNWKLRKVI